MKVKVTEHKGVVVIETLDPKQDADFMPAGGSKIGCHLANTGKNLGISKEALAVMKGYMISMDDLGEVHAFISDDGVHRFSWLGGTKRLVGPKAELSAKGFTDISHIEIPNEPPQEAITVIENQMEKAT